MFACACVSDLEKMNTKLRHKRFLQKSTSGILFCLQGYCKHIVQLHNISALRHSAVAFRVSLWVIRRYHRRDR